MRIFYHEMFIMSEKTFAFQDILNQPDLKLCFKVMEVWEVLQVKSFINSIPPNKFKPLDKQTIFPKAEGKCQVSKKYVKFFLGKSPILSEIKFQMQIRSLTVTFSYKNFHGPRLNKIQIFLIIGGNSIENIQFSSTQPIKPTTATICFCACAENSDIIQL